MTALTFTLSSLTTGAAHGHALICLAARYASVAWVGAARLDRRFIEPADWRVLRLALVVGLPSTPLSPTHIVTRMLVPDDRRTSILVQRLAERPLEVAPALVTETLDGVLRELAGRETPL